MSRDLEVKAPETVGRISRLSSSGLEIAITGVSSVEMLTLVSVALDLMIGAAREKIVKPKRRKSEKMERDENILRNNFWLVA